MSEDDVKILQQNCYCLGNSKFPLDKFFNDIRDNDSPNFDKNEAYEDLRLIVDYIFELISYKDFLFRKVKPKLKIEYYNCRGDSWDTAYNYYCPLCNSFVNDMNFCHECGCRLDWSDELGNCEV